MWSEIKTAAKYLRIKLNGLFCGPRKKYEGPLIDAMMQFSATRSGEEVVAKMQQHNVKLDHIVFLNLVAAPEGIAQLVQRFPEVHIVTAAVDDGLNDQKYIMPGLGDFGCRYFGTDQ